MQGERVVEFLLLDRSFPRSVLFCAERCLEAVRVISGDSAAAGALARDARRQALLRRRARSSTCRRSDALLGEVLAGVHAVGSELGGAYFATRVVLPGPYAQQQQQQ